MTYFSKPTASHMTWANQFSMGDIITVLQVGCVLATFFLASLQFPVSGTPYTYHNGLAMFTADTGQHTALGLALQQLPAKGAAAQSATQPFPLLYGDKITFLNFFFFEFEKIIFQDHLVPPQLQCFFLLQALQPQLRQLQWPV